jgi:hypothetical protein
MRAQRTLETPSTASIDIQWKVSEVDGMAMEKHGRTARLAMGVAHLGPCDVLVSPHLIPFFHLL